MPDGVGRRPRRPRRATSSPSTRCELEARRPRVDDEDVQRPVADLGVVVAVLARPRPRLEPPVDHLLPEVRGPRRQAGHAVDHVDDEVEPVEVVEHDHVERRRRRALLLVAAHVQVAVVRAPVGEAVDQPRVAVVGEDDRPVGREERVEDPVGEAVRMLALRLEAHQVDDVDDAHPQLRQVLAQDRGGGERLERRDVAAHASTTSRLAAFVVRGPVPDAEPARAVRDRLVHGEVVQRRLLAGHDHVHVVAAAQAVVGDREQRVRVGRQVDADDLGLLVHDVVDEARDPGARSRCGPGARRAS